MQVGEKITLIQKQVKRYAVLLAAAADFILIAIAIFSYSNAVKHLAVWDIMSEQIHIQDIDNQTSEGMLYITDEFPMKKGHYVYWVEYEGGAPDTWIYPYAYVDYYDKVEMKEFYFHEGCSGEKVEFGVNADLMVRFYLQHHGSGEVHIKEIHLEETPMQARKDLLGSMAWLAAVNILLFIYCYDKRHPIAVSTKYVFAGLSALVLIVSYPLFTGYALNGHDFDFHMVRIEGIKDGLLAGQFPVRINPDFFYGYGYANSIMYGELLLYFPALLRLAGISLTDTFCIYGFLVNVLTVFGAYWCFSRMLRDKAVGVIVTILYVTAPYRMLNMYLRIAAGEYSAMIFLPFLAYGLYGIYVSDTEEKSFRYRFIPLTIGLTGIIQTHVLTGEMAAIFIGLTCLVLIKRTFTGKRFRELAKSVGVTLLLNAWFLVPFADYYITQDIKVARVRDFAHIRKTGADLSQIMALFPQYEAENDMPKALGLALALGLVLCAVMLWAVKKEQCGVKKSACFFLPAGILATWMSTVYFPWDSVADRLGALGELLLAVQFSWRYLGIAMLFGAIAAGFALLMLKEKEGKQVFAAASVVLCMLAAISGIYFMQECMNQGAKAELSGLEGINTQHAAMEEEYILCKKNYDLVEEVHEPRVYGGAVIEDYEKQGTNIRFHAESNGAEGYVLLPLLAYKGYGLKFSEDSLGAEYLTEGPDAVVQVTIPEGFSGDIEVRFQGFWYWRLAEAVSVITLAALLLYVWRGRHNGRKVNM